MNIDPGTAIVIVAALIFYLRLIILQRQRVKQISQPAASAPPKKKHSNQPRPAAPRYALLSPNRRDWVIAGVGALLVVGGVLLNARVFPTIQPYWWVPTSIGILAFGWAFR